MREVGSSTIFTTDFANESHFTHSSTLKDNKDFELKYFLSASFSKFSVCQKKKKTKGKKVSGDLSCKTCEKCILYLMAYVGMGRAYSNKENFLEEKFVCFLKAFQHPTPHKNYFVLIYMRIGSLSNRRRRCFIFAPRSFICKIFHKHLMVRVQIEIEYTFEDIYSDMIIIGFLFIYIFFFPPSSVQEGAIMEKVLRNIQK